MRGQQTKTLNFGSQIDESQIDTTIEGDKKRKGVSPPVSPSSSPPSSPTRKKLRSRLKEMVTHHSDDIGNIHLTDVEQLYQEASSILKECGCDFESVRREGTLTPLHKAISGEVETARRNLRQGGFNINNLTNNKGFSPLHIAAQQGNNKVIELFIKLGANPNLKSKAGTIPLFEAMQQNKFLAILSLINYGATLDDTTDIFRLSSLYQSILRGNTRQLHSATQDEVILYKITPRDLAEVQKRAIEATNIFSVNDSSTYSKEKAIRLHPLHAAVLRGDKTVISAYSELKGYDMNPQIQKQSSLSKKITPRLSEIFPGMTPFHVAAWTGNVDIIKQLDESYNAALCSTALGGMTPLHIAILRGNGNAIDYLLENSHKHNINVQTTKESLTPLYLAAQMNDRITVKKLLKANADSTICSKNGETPLDIAKKSGFSDVETALTKKEEVKSIVLPQSFSAKFAASKGLIASSGTPSPRNILLEAKDNRAMSI